MCSSLSNKKLSFAGVMISQVISTLWKWHHNRIIFKSTMSLKNRMESVHTETKRQIWIDHCLHRVILRYTVTGTNLNWKGALVMYGSTFERKTLIICSYHACFRYWIRVFFLTHLKYIFICYLNTARKLTSPCSGGYDFQNIYHIIYLFTFLGVDFDTVHFDASFAWIPPPMKLAMIETVFQQ